MFAILACLSQNKLCLINVIRGKLGQNSDAVSVAYLTIKVNPSLAKRPLNFNGRLAKLGLTFIVK